MCGYDFFLALYDNSFSFGGNFKLVLDSDFKKLSENEKNYKDNVFFLQKKIIKLNKMNQK